MNSFPWKVGSAVREEPCLLYSLLLCQNLGKFLVCDHTKKKEEVRKGEERGKGVRMESKRERKGGRERGERKEKGKEDEG